MEEEEEEEKALEVCHAAVEEGSHLYAWLEEGVCLGGERRALQGRGHAGELFEAARQARRQVIGRCRDARGFRAGQAFSPCLQPQASRAARIYFVFA